MKTKLLSFLVPFMALGLSACESDPREVDNIETRPKISERERSLIEDLGFKTDGIVVTEDAYWVEGDIVIPKEQLEEIEQGSQTRQNYYGIYRLVSPTKVRNIKIAVSYYNSSSNEPIDKALSICAGQLDGAIAALNNLPNCAVKISKVNYNQNPDILIETGGGFTWNSPVHQEIMCAGEIPSGEYPGRSVFVNAEPYPTGTTAGWKWTSISAVKVKTALIHAIGHCLGLAHTDCTSPPYPTGVSSELEEDHQWINGTMSGDSKSIMNLNEHTYKNTIRILSDGDKEALKVLYPVTALTPGSIPSAQTINQTGGTFSIYSTSDATGEGSITYGWEVKSGSTWTSVSGQTDKNLVRATAPKQLTTKYRRKATAGTTDVYSNECTVTNDAYKPLAPGKITAALSILTENPADFITISSIEDASYPAGNVSYSWEIKSGSSWTVISGQTGKNLVNAAAPQRLTTWYRRKATGGTKFAYSNECTVTNQAHKLHETGSITASLVIDAENPSHLITVSSIKDAFCPTGTVVYVWEINDNDVWNIIPNASSASMQTNAPMQYETRYRRKAVCSHPTTEYSNECTVYNEAFIDAGTIPELVELYKTGLDSYLHVPSLTAASLTNPLYGWEVDTGYGWTYFGSHDTESLSYETVPRRRITMLRRWVSIPSGFVYSNECTVINHAFWDSNPREGTSEAYAKKFGPYSTDFVQDAVIDTRRELFYDHDLRPFCGNDVFFELEISTGMNVDIITDALFMYVYMTIWNLADRSVIYSGNAPHGGTGFTDGAMPFPGFDDEYGGYMSFYAAPGKYLISLQGSKASNGGIFSNPIYINMRGRK